MMKSIPLLVLSIILTFSTVAKAENKQRVEAIIKPLMEKYQIPGMAIAITLNGKNDFYNYGVASKETRQPVTNQTLFEIGSLSKTFTATLASWAQQQRKIAWERPASQYLPTLKGSAFDHISLLNLATHTSGLPLFVPDDIKTDEQLFSGLSQWHPAQPVGKQRVYSNIGIGLLGVITAKSLNQPFSDVMQQRLLPALGLHHTFVQVPNDKLVDYAQGYNKQNSPVRLNPGVLDAEAYGLKSSSADLIRYLTIQLHNQPIEASWQNAIDATHIGYYQVAGKAGFTQNLMWESSAYPSSLQTLLENNGSKNITQPQNATLIIPPQSALEQAIYNKTGSTGGFSAYALFVPIKKMGIVILANKAYPNEARVKAAYEILAAMNHGF